MTFNLRLCVLMFVFIILVFAYVKAEEKSCRPGVPVDSGIPKLASVSGPKSLPVWTNADEYKGNAKGYGPENWVSTDNKGLVITRADKTPFICVVHFDPTSGLRFVVTENIKGKGRYNIVAVQKTRSPGIVSICKDTRKLNAVTNQKEYQGFGLLADPWQYEKFHIQPAYFKSERMTIDQAFRDQKTGKYILFGSYPILLDDFRSVVNPGDPNVRVAPGIGHHYAHPLTFRIEAIPNPDGSIQKAEMFIRHPRKPGREVILTGIYVEAGDGVIDESYAKGLEFEVKDPETGEQEQIWLYKIEGRNESDLLKKMSIPKPVAGVDYTPSAWGLAQESR